MLRLRHENAPTLEQAGSLQAASHLAPGCRQCSNLLQTPRAAGGPISGAIAR